MNQIVSDERVLELAKLNLGYDHVVRILDFARAIEREVLAAPVAGSAMAKDAALLRELAAIPRHDPNTVLKYDIKVLHVRGDLLRRIDAAIAAAAEKGDKA